MSTCNNWVCWLKVHGTAGHALTFALCARPWSERIGTFFRSSGRRSTLLSECRVWLVCERRCGRCRGRSLAPSTAGPAPRPFPSFPSFQGWVLGVKWRFYVGPVPCQHRWSPYCCVAPLRPLFYGWSEIVRTSEVPRRGLWPRSLPTEPETLNNLSACSMGSSWPQLLRGSAKGHQHTHQVLFPGGNPRPAHALHAGTPPFSPHRS